MFHQALNLVKTVFSWSIERIHILSPSWHILGNTDWSYLSDPLWSHLLRQVPRKNSDGNFVWIWDAFPTKCRFVYCLGLSLPWLKHWIWAVSQVHLVSFSFGLKITPLLPTWRMSNEMHVGAICQIRSRGTKLRILIGPLAEGPGI